MKSTGQQRENLLQEHTFILWISKGSVFQHCSSTVQLHMVHLLEIPPEVTDGDVISSNFQIGRSITIQQIVYLKFIFKK